MKPPLLFVTYYRTEPVAQMGVVKRCLRLMTHLRDEFELHLVNAGPLPLDDPRFRELREELTLHDSPWGNMGNTHQAILRKVRPIAIVLGEAPMRGHMRMAHRVATRAGVWQIAIDNCYDTATARRYAEEWSAVDRWLLLGLSPWKKAHRIHDNLVVAPPLVQVPDELGRLDRDRITIAGYDEQALRCGIALLGQLAATQKVDCFIARGGRELLESAAVDVHRTGFRLFESPPDGLLYDSIARSRLLVGKAGYQQVVESLLLGTPVLARACGGGIEDSLLTMEMRPHVRIVESEDQVPRLMPDVKAWLSGPPITRWSDLAIPGSHTSSIAAEALKALALEGNGAHAPSPSTPHAGHTLVDEFLRLKRCLEKKRWDELRTILPRIDMTLFGATVDRDAFVDELQSRFSNALDFKLQPMSGPRSESDGSMSLPCCFLWGLSETEWDEHELEVDLRVRWRERDGRWLMEELAITRL